MCRFKRSFGKNIRSGKIAYWQAELLAKPLDANSLAKLGIPKSQWVLP
ncbi:hypothetical protein NEOC95_002375 [Neochlamydia sp. AcF95]|nr:hypothetical protein [Neochlamydia sp. AcF95]